MQPASSATSATTNRTGATPRRRLPLATSTARQVGLEDAGDDFRLVRAERQRRAGDRLPRHSRDRQPEDRTAAPLAPRLQPAAVQVRVFEGDREPEAGAPCGPGPCRVGPPEPLEDQLLLAWAEPDPVVADRDGHGVAVRGDGDHDVPALTV